MKYDVLDVITASLVAYRINEGYYKSAPVDTKKNPIKLANSNLMILVLKGLIDPRPEEKEHAPKVIKFTKSLILKMLSCEERITPYIREVSNIADLTEVTDWKTIKLIASIPSYYYNELSVQVIEDSISDKDVPAPGTMITVKKLKVINCVKTWTPSSFYITGITQDNVPVSFISSKPYPLGEYKSVTLFNNFFVGSIIRKTVRITSILLEPDVSINSK